ncbi:MAG: UPF0182 family protein [Gemmatimonadales bacterium]|nr:UPF0182 family protein [Gemmatimonadales bacterium]
MSRRGRRLTAALGGLVALLFAGRWTAGLLADRWWAAEISPAAVAFLTDWHILRLTLDLTGVLVASTWFIGHLLLVYRAVGSVQVRRSVANLEFREALTPGALLAAAVAVGALLGLIVGSGTSGWWEEVAIGWHGVSYGVAEPLMRHDLGLYVAQLPLWRAAHGAWTLLILMALGLVFALYMVVGAVRWIEGRPAINNHARAHLGWLLVGLALALLWGYLLEPYELVAGIGGGLDLASWRATTLAARPLAGMALATAIFSAAWALQPRHALLAGGWIALGLGSVVGHWMVPAAVGGEGAPAVEAATRDRFNRMAYGVDPLLEETLSLSGTPAPPRLPSMWNPQAVSRVMAGDSVEVLAVDPAVLALQGRRRPAWLAARVLPGDRLSLAAIADDQVSPAGEPLFYLAGDSVPSPVFGPLLELGSGSFRPNAPAHRLTGADDAGVPASGWMRRVLLAWALQAGELLGQLPAGTRIDWRLSPSERLERLAPFAQWSAPIPRVIDGELVWLADGYLTADAFPLTDRLSWREPGGETVRRVAAVEAAFLASVDARTGIPRIYLRPGADGLAESWAGISRGVVDVASAAPEPLLQAAPYPLELLRAQARVVEQGPWAVGNLSGRTAQSAEPPRVDLGWSADTSVPELLVSFERADERRLSAVLVAGRDEGRDLLRLLRVDSAATLPSLGALESRWSRFASYDALSDSIRDEGGRLERGPIRLAPSPTGIVAYQSHFTSRGPGGLVLAWVSVAEGARLGAGRTLRDAWSNLLGASVPDIPGSAQATRLEDARRWLERADSALREADWPGFGQAWQELRRSLGMPTDSAAP